jgi:hypothetical protein
MLALRNVRGCGGCSAGVAACAEISGERTFLLISVNLYQHCFVEDSNAKCSVGHDTNQYENARLQSGHSVHRDSLGNWILQHTSILLQ